MEGFTFCIFPKNRYYFTPFKYKNFYRVRILFEIVLNITC